MSTLWLPEREKSYVIFAYTGQGEQHPEMLMPWYNHPSESVQSALYTFHDLTGVPWAKPLDEEALKRGILMQPANVTLAVAVTLALKEAGIIPNETMGHSLGEYGAMVGAGFVDPEPAIQLAEKRGQFTDMNIRELIRLGEFTGMMALTAKTGEILESILKAIKVDESQDIDVANHNTKAQAVLSGTLNAMRSVIPAINEMSGRTIELQVDGAYHSKKMRLAAQLMRQEVDNLSIRRGSLARMYSPTYVREIKGRDDLANMLVLQLTSSVFWQQLINSRLEYLNSARVQAKLQEEGGEEIVHVEIGPDKSGRPSNKGTLIGITERNVRDFGDKNKIPIRYHRVSTSDDLCRAA